MNDERGASAAGENGAVASEADVARLAVPAQRTSHPVAGDPLALSHRDKRLIAISMMLPVFLGSVDQSVLASALPTIGRDLGQVHNLPWLVTAFLIASTALTPLYGKFADVHGRRAAMLIGISIYMIGSLISAASPNMLMLIGGRVVQGCGAGGLVVTANMVLGDIAAPKERGRYYTYFSIAFMTAGGSGPALGGWISEHLRWPMIFLWNFPLCAVAIAIALTVLRRLPRRERQHRLDVVGAVLVIAASSRRSWSARWCWAQALFCAFAPRSSPSFRSRFSPIRPHCWQSPRTHSAGGRSSASTCFCQCIYKARWAGRRPRPV